MQTKCLKWVWRTFWTIQNQIQWNKHWSHLCTIDFQRIKCQAYHSHRLLASVLIVNELGVCKQLFVQFAPTLRPNAALWQCACNHLSISHILSLHPCHGGKLTHFDTALFPDWSVIGTLHLLSAPNALWVFSRHDPIFPYFSPARGKLTNNTRISHCFYCCSS